MFQPTFEFMRTHGLALASSPFARMVHMSKREDGSYLSIYQAWTPYEGETSFCNPVKRDRDKPSKYLEDNENYE